MGTRVKLLSGKGLETWSGLNGAGGGNCGLAAMRSLLWQSGSGSFPSTPKMFCFLGNEQQRRAEDPLSFISLLLWAQHPGVSGVSLVGDVGSGASRHWCGCSRAQPLLALPCRAPCAQGTANPPLTLGPGPGPSRTAVGKIQVANRV